MMRNKIFTLIVLIGLMILAINILFLKYNNINVKIINQKYVFNFLDNDKNKSDDINIIEIKYINDKNYKEQLQNINFYDYLKFKLDDLSLNNNSSKVKCTLQSCFDLKKCEQNFKIYIYDEPSAILSDIFKKILNVLNNLNSDYLTQDPNEACLYVHSVDTLDRDKLSSNYVNNLNDLLKFRNETNHLIVNLYSGTWPNYSEELDFNVTKAIIAKASFSDKLYRKNFDISFPLFHSDLPYNITSYLPTYPKTLITDKKRYLVTFKGKRYLHGVGSETRNSIYHLNNNRDILLLTTCKHGLNWRELKDERCDIDNDLYEKYDYNELLISSTFCLVPRGRRLGTYRFLEALKVGCIPVLLSNGWVLPFSEVLDWNKAVIWGDERLISVVKFD
jgi:glucuronyl/N-acetylglucosaminyl transferase EXT1